ncbi:hypothetical protein [Burkholderia pseudomallei]|uniref:hypothetical protein n=1 Tax=Burkholderia pseudomallei TaxID=28450 RepID=UPI0009C511C4|nr:hypothetical protein [Burkholderia pseudomallei]OMT83517.1 hypothetical protein AQ765_09625 [Burkholderia pseudomallei]
MPVMFQTKSPRPGPHRRAKDPHMKPLRFHSEPIAAPSLHASHASVRDRTAPVRMRAERANPRVLMSIRVGAGNLPHVRRLLHQMLGAALDIYTAVIDNQTGQASLQLELASTSVSDAMTSIMRVLPEAEFGKIRLSPRAPSARAPRMPPRG